MVRTAIANLRMQIAAGRPHDEAESRRMALRATKDIPDDADRGRLYEALAEALSLIALRRILGGDAALGLVDVERVIAEIEACVRLQMH